MTKITDHDFPIDEIAEAALAVLDQGGKVHQKWTCQHCGARQIMEEPNKFFRSGRCEECREVTIIKSCNYLAVFVARP